MSSLLLVMCIEHVFIFEYQINEPINFAHPKFIIM